MKKIIVELKKAKPQSKGRKFSIDINLRIQF